MSETFVTLSCQAEDFDTGAARPEETLELRIFWDQDAEALAWEPLSYTRERRGELLYSERFDTDLGEQMVEWGASHFEKTKYHYEYEHEDFAEMRDHARIQFASDRSRHQSAAL